MKTVNRGWLKRQVSKGLLEAKSVYRLTDDYKNDLANNFGISKEWNDCFLLSEESAYPSATPRKIMFKNWDFQTKSGRAYQYKNGVITLHIHSNLCFELRFKQ